MATLAADFPTPHADEREMYLDWLRFLRGAIVRKAEGLSENQAHTRPHGALISMVGIVNHLTGVETRWIDGRMHGVAMERHETEFVPGPDLTLADALERYEQRALATAEAVRSMALDTPCSSWDEGTDLRWVLVHLINETARHAGHADAVRELIDGATGE